MSLSKRLCELNWFTMYETFYVRLQSILKDSKDKYIRATKILFNYWLYWVLPKKIWDKQIQDFIQDAIIIIDESKRKREANIENWNKWWRPKSNVERINTIIDDYRKSLTIDDQTLDLLPLLLSQSDDNQINLKQLWLAEEKRKEKNSGEKEKKTASATQWNPSSLCPQNQNAVNSDGWMENYATVKNLISYFQKAVKDTWDFYESNNDEYHMKQILVDKELKDWLSYYYNTTLKDFMSLLVRNSHAIHYENLHINSIYKLRYKYKDLFHTIVAREWDELIRRFFNPYSEGSTKYYERRTNHLERFKEIKQEYRRTWVLR